MEWSGGVYDNDDHGNGGRDAVTLMIMLNLMLMLMLTRDRSRPLCLHMRSTIDLVNAVCTCDQRSISSMPSSYFSMRSVCGIVNAILTVVAYI